MTTNGVQAVYLETHNWGKAARFLQSPNIGHEPAATVALGVHVAGAAENDLLDAAAVAWSARRIAAGAATTLTNCDQPADDGTEIAIRY